MMQFWIIVAAMMVAAVAILAPALLRRREHGEELDRDRQNVVIARERLAELEAERDEGILTQEQYEEAKAELEQALLQDLEQQEQSAREQDASARRLGLIGLGAIVVLVPLLSLGLYYELGSPELALPADQRVAAHQQGAGQNMSMEQMVEALVRRLKDNPDDAEGWFLLGRTYMATREFAKAAATFERLYAMVGDEPVLLLAWADAQAMTQNGDLKGKPAELIRKAVQAAPDDPTALWLAGMVEEQEGNHRKALAYWERLAPMVEDDPESKQRVASLIAVARERAGLPPAEPAAAKAPAAGGK